MARSDFQPLAQFGSGILCCLGVSLALAAPPNSHVAADHRQGPPGRPERPERSERPERPLDLRPPAQVEVSMFTNARSASLGSMPRNEGRDFSRFASPDDKPRSVGRIQAFAERVHREGLPLARLWENHSALVSLGLNPKGKAGLWLVQKTH